MPKNLSHLITTVLDSTGFFPHPPVKPNTNLCTIVALLVVVGQWVILCSKWPLGSPVHFFLNLFLLFPRFLFLHGELLFSLLPTVPSSCIHLLLPLFLPFPKCADTAVEVAQSPCNYSSITIMQLCQPDMGLGKLFQVSLTSTLCLSLQESRLLISRICLWQLLTISIHMYSPLSTSEKEKKNLSDYTKEWHEQGE